MSACTVTLCCAGDYVRVGYREVEISRVCFAASEGENTTTITLYVK